MRGNRKEKRRKERNGYTDIEDITVAVSVVDYRAIALTYLPQLYYSVPYSILCSTRNPHTQVAIDLPSHTIHM